MTAPSVPSSKTCALNWSRTEPRTGPARSAWDRDRASTRDRDRTRQKRPHTLEIKAEEISHIIRKQIEEYDQKVSIMETGTVLTVGDGIARVYGLSGAMAGELLDFPHGVKGLVLNLEEDNVGVALLGAYEKIRENDQVKRTGQIA